MRTQTVRCISRDNACTCAVQAAVAEEGHEHNRHGPAPQKLHARGMHAVNPLYAHDRGIHGEVQLRQPVYDGTRTRVGLNHHYTTTTPLHSVQLRRTVACAVP